MSLIKFAKTKNNSTWYLNFTTKTCFCDRNISTEKNVNRKFIKIRIQNARRNRNIITINDNFTFYGDRQEQTIIDCKLRWRSKTIVRSSH